MAEEHGQLDFYLEVEYDRVQRRQAAVARVRADPVAPPAPGDDGS